MTGGDGVAEELVDGGAERGGAFGDRRAAAAGLRVVDAVGAPTAALGAGVEEHGLETVAGVGEFRLGRGARFKLIPQCAEFAGLVGGEEAEDAVGGAGFAVVLVDDGGGVVGEGVAGVDFHEVVDEAHLEDAENVEVRDVGVFGEHHDAEAESPGVLGVVLGATALGVDRLAEDFLQLVALDDEGDLLGEALGGGGGSDHANEERDERAAGNGGGGGNAG